MQPRGNFCTMTVAETKSDLCPDGASFNILNEYEKPAAEWRIDFNVRAEFDFISSHLFCFY